MMQYLVIMMEVLSITQDIRLDPGKNNCVWKKKMITKAETVMGKLQKKQDSLDKCAKGKL